MTRGGCRGDSDNRRAARYTPCGDNREVEGAGPSYDPGEPTTTPYEVNAVVVPTEVRDRSGTLIEDATSTAYIAAKGLAIVPQTQDRLLWSGRDYRVVRVMPIDPSGAKPLLYELRVEE